MLKYLRVRIPDFADRQQASSIDILDLYSVIIRDHQIEDQLKHILVKDTYEFETIFKPITANMEIYTSLIQYNVDHFIELNSFRFILKGDSKSGRTHCLIGIAQDPGLLLIFTGHLFYRLEELKKLENNANYENRFNYKIFLKCYTKVENNYYDLLTNCKEPLNDFESVISFDSQLGFLKLLRIILKNIDQRKFETAKEFHLYQQNQGSFRLGQVTFDFILEKTITTWYGVQEIKTSHFKFETIDLSTTIPIYDQDRVIYFLNPALKYGNSAKQILRDSKHAKTTPNSNNIDQQIIKNKFNFSKISLYLVLRSLKIIKNNDILIQLQTLFKQFKKETDKLNMLLDLKSEVIEVVQQQLKVDIQVIGKIISSVDVREFLLSKFLLYQVTESFDECLPFQQKLGALFQRIKKIKKQKRVMLADYDDDKIETRVFKDIRRNLSDIINYLRNETFSEQHRAYNYLQIKKYIFEEFINILPEIQLQEEIKVEPTQQSDGLSLPSIDQKKHLRSKLNSVFIGNSTKRTDNLLTIPETMRMIKQSSRNPLITDRQQIPRLKTEKAITISPSQQQLKVIQINSTPRGIALSSPMFINLNCDKHSIVEFKNNEDYKKLNSINTSNSKILNTMSELSSEILQNSIMNSKEIIKDFRSKIKLSKQQALFRMPNLSSSYLECIERMVNLNLNSKQ